MSVIFSFLTSFNMSAEFIYEMGYLTVVEGVTKLVKFLDPINIYNMSTNPRGICR